MFGLLLARILGLEEYGGFVLASGVILFLSGVQIALIVSPMRVKIPILTSDRQLQYLQSCLTQQFVYSVFSSILVVICGWVITAFFHTADIGNMVWAIALAAASFVFQDFFRRYFLMVGRPGAAICNDLVSYGMRIIGIVAVYLLAPVKATQAVWVVAGASVIGVIVALSQVGWLKALHIPERHIWKDVVEENWSFGKWLLLENIAVWGQNQLIMYLCGIVLSVAAVGALGACRNIVGVVNILFLTMNTLLPTRASQRYNMNGLNGLHKYLKRATYWGGIVTATFALIAAVGSEFWLSFLYGPDYIGYGWLVKWYALQAMISFFIRPLWAGLSVLNSTRSIFVANFVGALLTAAIAFPAVKLWALQGALIAMCTVQVAVVCVLGSEYRRRYPRMADLQQGN